MYFEFIVEYLNIADLVKKIKRITVKNSFGVDADIYSRKRLKSIDMDDETNKKLVKLFENERMESKIKNKYEKKLLNI